MDVVAVIAVKRRPHHRAFADAAKQLVQHGPTHFGGFADRGVVTHHPSLGRNLISLQLGVARLIQLTGEHLLFFGHRHVWLQRS